MRKFYITTSIAYTNAPPHLGYALETIQADVLARYHRILGEDVFFLTGADEHGAKIVKAAAAANKKLKDFTDEISGRFKDLTKVLAISNNDFIRTTDQKRHWPAVQKFWLKLKKNGDIFKKNYHGLYCVGCEAFITPKDLIDGICEIHQKEPEVINEENYFFKLSKYSKKIEEIIKKGKIKIIPDERKNEMLSFVGRGLEDVSFSRPRKDLGWGIQVPGDDSQTIYVWADALLNYISAPESKSIFKKYWPPDIHFLGKDILRFHATIWLGMLLAVKLSLPKNIFVHGFITSAGQKMSKSLGNVIDPFELAEKYSADAVRYFLLREISPTEDGDFTREKFERRYNSDLASGLGNLVARVITMAAKQKSKIKKPKIIPISSRILDKVGTNKNLELFIGKTQKKCHRLLNEFRFNEALAAIWELIGFCDRYIEKERPWSFDPVRDKEKSQKVMSDLLSTISEIAEMLKPFLPETSEKILEQLEAKKSQPLFPRAQ